MIVHYVHLYFSSSDENKCNKTSEIERVSNADVNFILLLLIYSVTVAI